MTHDKQFKDTWILRGYPISRTVPTLNQVLALDTSDNTWKPQSVGALGAPQNAQYVVLTTNATLTDERVLAGTTNQITVTDGGAGGNVTLSTPQNIHTGASPTFSGLTLSGLTASTFIYSNASKAITSTTAPTNGQLLIGSTGAVPVVAALTGTVNQITVTNGAGSITLSTPQDIGTASTPTFGGLTIADGGNIVLNTTTGTKIGTATTQKIGFWNTTPAVQPPAYTITNDTTDRTYNADATTVDELADIIATMYRDLKAVGIFA